MNAKVDDDLLKIPDFLRRSTLTIKKTGKMKYHSVTYVTPEPSPVTPRPSHIPKGYTIEEWDAFQKEKREREEKVKAPPVKKEKPKPIDTTGMRWDGLKGKWVVDKAAHLCSVAIPVSEKKKRIVNKKSVAANSFGIPEGTNRDKLARAMAKRLGEMVTLKEWSKSVYGKENEGPCDRVMAGFILDIKKRQLKFEIVKDKNDKGQVIYGLYETE